MNQHPDRPQGVLDHSSTRSGRGGFRLAILPTLVLSLSACGSVKDAPTADSLGSNTMSGTVLETFAQTAPPEMQIMLIGYASGKSFGRVGAPPLLGFLGGGVAGLSLAQTKSIQAKAERTSRVGA
jgi:hypothetical protein